MYLRCVLDDVCCAFVCGVCCGSCGCVLHGRWCVWCVCVFCMRALCGVFVWYVGTVCMCVSSGSANSSMRLTNDKGFSQAGGPRSRRSLFLRRVCSSLFSSGHRGLRAIPVPHRLVGREAEKVLPEAVRRVREIHPGGEVVSSL